METGDFLTVIPVAALTIAFVLGFIYWIYSIILKSPNNWIFLSVGFIATVIACFILDNPVTPLVVALLSFIVFIISGYDSQCPSCDTWWNRSKTRCDFLGRSSYSSTRTKSESVYDSSYRHVGYVDVKVPTEVVTERYKDHYQCDSCNHYWTETRSDTREYDL